MTRLGRVLVLGLACTALSVSGCTSSHPGSGGAASTSARASSGSPTGTPPARGTAAVCADIASLKQINDEFAQVASNLAKARSLMVGLKSITHRLTVAAPTAIAGDATAYTASVAVLASFVNKVHSIAQLKSQATADPKLKAAVTSLASSGAALSTWRTSNC